jgi:hypothetical protein
MKHKVVMSTFALVFSVTFATSWTIAIPKESGQVERLKASMPKLQKALVENKGQINYNTNS